MTEKTIWVCDGCDRGLVRTSRGTDWKSVSLTVSGLDGYPTCRPDQAQPDHFHLCPDCARRFLDGIRPRFWPLAVEQSPPPPADWDNSKSA